MQPCSHSVQICGDAVGPKYVLMSSVNGRGMSKGSQDISKLISSTESNAQDGHPVKSENSILPTAQMKGARLVMKSSHQGLPNPMPHGVRGDPKKILEPLHSQEICIVLVGPTIKQ